MGSPTVSNAKPVPMDENTDKKSFKSRLKDLFRKKKDKNEVKTEQPQTKNDRNEVKTETKPHSDEVENIVGRIEKINIQNEETTTEKPEEDELDNFDIKIIEVSRNERIHSHSSGDSGFSEKSENSDKSDSSEKLQESDKTEIGDKCDNLAENLEKLGLDDDTNKQKKLQTVVIKRGPTRNKLCNYTSGSPYPTRDADPYRQISQINTKTLTGGQVIVNQCQLPTDNLSEIDIACKTVQQNSQYLQNDSERYLEDVLEYIHEDTTKPIQNGFIDILKSNTILAGNKMAVPFDSEPHAQDLLLADIENETIGQDEILQLLKENNYQITETDLPQPSPIEDMVNDSNFEKDVFNYVQTELNSMSSDDYLNAAYTYPTPPRSENEPSSMSASPSSFYPSNSEYTLSPERSPIYNSDYEKYQYIPSFEEEKEIIDKKARERTVSASSMTMKQFKDMQKEIVQNFSKKECCQLNRKSCVEIFQEHMAKLKVEDRKELCLKVAMMDLKAAYGVLHHIILNMSRGSEQEELHYVLFSLVCERVLGQDIAMFTGDAGLSLLKAATLRCPHKPLLTRYLVQCIQTAVKSDPSLAAGKDYIFHEVDALGDTLVIACARAGDKCSDVLYELVRACADQPPLFKLRHNNADGYTALHVACSHHSAASPRLHTVHVLLEHGGFELTEGDVKGKDTALHLAVNSVNCDIQLILLMFKQVDRKEWKNMAHYPNLSSKTPLDLARLATKSTSRPNYPPEVLDFLKKCR